MKHFRRLVIFLALLPWAHSSFAQLAPLQLEVTKQRKPLAFYTDAFDVSYIIELSGAMKSLKDVRIKWAILVEQSTPSYRLKVIQGERTYDLDIGQRVSFDTRPIRTGDSSWNNSSSANYDPDSGASGVASATRPIIFDKVEGYEVQVYVNGQPVASDVQPPDILQKIEEARTWEQKQAMTNGLSSATRSQENASVPVSSPVQSSPAGPTVDTMRALAERIAGGDQTAFEQLRKTAAELYRDIDYNKEQGRVGSNLVLMRAAFNVLGQKAGEGNENAFQALKASLGTDSLRSFAPGALGIAAAAGRKDALDILVNPRAWGILKSSAVFALHAPAQANMDPAVDYLVAVIQNMDDRPLWFEASEGLVGAAIKGNQKASAALQKYAEASQNKQ